MDPMDVSDKGPGEGVPFFLHETFPIFGPQTKFAMDLLRFLPFSTPVDGAAVHVSQKQLMLITIVMADKFRVVSVQSLPSFLLVARTKTELPESGGQIQSSSSSPLLITRPNELVCVSYTRVHCPGILFASSFWAILIITELRI